jgi:peptidyl-prolyl cis-trans isomerase A (cyclophilin A)
MLTRQGVSTFCTAFLLGIAPAAAQDTIRVRIETEAGTMVAELYARAAPNPVANFLHYVDGGFYTNGRFHRTVREDNQPNNAVKITVIQAAADSTARRKFPPVSLERTSVTGLRHLDGSLSMARSGPDTATHEIFICIGDQPELDFGGKRNADGQGFAAFGRVVQGMDVARRINAMPANAQSLRPPVRILKIERIAR